jgi:uncharacterized protein (TIGR02246 family)
MTILDTQREEQAIRQLIADWLEASKTGDHKRVLELMADDAVFLLPGRTPMRKADFEAAQDAQRNFDIDGKADIQEIEVLDDHAWVWNHLTVTMTPHGGEPVVRRGNVLTILRKQADGRWVITRDANLLTVVAD